MEKSELEQEQDKVLAHIKSYLPDFTWGCELEIVNLDHWISQKQHIGKKFKAVSLETWRKDSNRSIAILHMTNARYGCAIDPLNTYGINYYFKSLKVASPVKEEKTTKMDKSEAKKKADALMSCLPDFIQPPAKKPVKESAPMESACPEPLRKFSVGDSVLYLGEITTVVAKRYANNDYIVEYSRGWTGNPSERTSEGKLVGGKKYNYVSESFLQAIPKVKESIVSKQDPITPPLHTPPSSTIPDFKVGDWVVITNSGRNWDSGMNKYDGKCVQITSLTSYGSAKFQNDGGWSWVYEDNHFRKATSQEIAHELSKLQLSFNSTIKSTIAQLDGFTVGDKVKVIEGGSGIHYDDEGKYVTITELGVGKYISLRSFEVPRVGGTDPYKDHDVIWNQAPPRVPFGEPKSSDIVALKEEPHIVTTSLAEPLVLQIEKKSSKIVTV